MKALGDQWELVSSPTTTATWVSLKDADTVSIIAVGASDTTNVTVSIAKDASGTGAQTYAPGSTVACDGITSVWTQHNGVWTLVTQAAAATFATLSGTGDVAIAEINCNQIPAAVSGANGFSYIKASHANAQLIIMLSYLAVKRKPSNLRNKTV